MAKPTIKSLLWLLLAIVAFYWNIVFSGQYSMMTDPETVTQAYTWFHFWADSIRHGSWPLWDPYAFGGRSFVGEMQTAAFYPLHLIFALFPANGAGCWRRNCIICTSCSRTCWPRISCLR